jgi:hypothetical protein
MFIKFRLSDYGGNSNGTEIRRNIVFGTIYRSVGNEYSPVSDRKCSIRFGDYSCHLVGIGRSEIAESKIELLPAAEVVGDGRCVFGQGVSPLEENVSTMRWGRFLC